MNRVQRLRRPVFPFVKLERPLRTSRLLRLRVSSVTGAPAKGKLLAGGSSTPCVLGRGGITHAKREGDGKTPAGVFSLSLVFVRRDRKSRPVSGLPQRSVRPADGWCDDPTSALYNRLVRLPCGAGHERLWRQDRLYDMVIVVDHNTGCVRKGRGSAIFLHVQEPSGTPTAGCVAMDPAALRKLLTRIGPKTRLTIC